MCKGVVSVDHSVCNDGVWDCRREVRDNRVWRALPLSEVTRDGQVNFFTWQSG